MIGKPEVKTLHVPGTFFPKLIKAIWIQSALLPFGALLLTYFLLKFALENPELTLESELYGIAFFEWIFITFIIFYIVLFPVATALIKKPYIDAVSSAKTKFEDATHD